METEIPILDMLTRLLVATGLALCLGLERELRGKPAGLRSHMLVSLGSSAFIIVGLSVLFGSDEGDARQVLIQIALLRVWLEVLGFWALAVLFAAALTFKGLRQALRSGWRAPSALPQVPTISHWLAWSPS